MQKCRAGTDRKRKGILKHEREKALKTQFAEKKKELQQKFSTAFNYK